MAEKFEKKIELDKKYILFPIKNNASKCRVTLKIEGKIVRDFEAELAEDKKRISFWAFLDITQFKGKTSVLHAEGASLNGFNLIKQSDNIPGENKFYKEKRRPQFHFTQKIGWNNDPNGMVYYDGEWHLFFQHNPYGWNWGNMHWGHAVSKDLVHWEQLPIAIYNHQFGDWVFSGGAVVDKNNTAGFQKGKEKVIIASYTSTCRGECIAYSNDRGRTFKDYEGNPVVKHNGRDPKIIWHKPTKRWVMVVYDESKKNGQSIAFYNSKNLKDWKLQSKLKNYFECPEIFKLPIDGNNNNTRWVLLSANAQYVIGEFDGKKFTPEYREKLRVHWGNYYASQTFSNSPDERRIQIGWVQIEMPGMPFNQMFSFPHELTLRTTEDGLRMFAKPINEIKLLHKKKHEKKNIPLKQDKKQKIAVSGNLFDIRAEIEIKNAESVGIEIGSKTVIYNAKLQKLEDAPLKLVNGKIKMQILIDRSCMEICANDGRVYITKPFYSSSEIKKISVFSKKGDAKLISLEIYELQSIWNNK